MDKNRILICMTNLPYPVRQNGISIRYYPIIAHLSRSFHIDLVVIADHVPSDDSLAEARQFCGSVNVYVRKKIKVPVYTKILARVTSLLPDSIPFLYFRYDNREIKSFFRKTVEGKHYNYALCVCLGSLDIVRGHAKYDRLFLDFIDSPYSTQSRLPNRSFFEFYDKRRLKKYERSALQKVDHAIYISPLDLKIGSGQSELNSNVSIVPNGLYVEDRIDEKIDFGGKSIRYLGNMAYPPNIKAAKRLLKIHKRLRKNIKGLQLVIIGRDPTDEILSHQNDAGVTITGTVDNIWPYINGIDIFVFPMEIGSGQQNKILEAMGAAKPVITTKLGNSGIGAINGEHIIEADSDATIEVEIRTLLANERSSKELANKGKSFIEDRYSWKSTFEKIDSIVAF
jgi:glycosyltransferase involved in cell wall biosynthesis